MQPSDGKVLTYRIKTDDETEGAWENKDLSSQVLSLPATRSMPFYT